MARDDRFPDEVGMDRRGFIKAAVSAGAVGLAGALVASGKTLLPPPIEPPGTVFEGFVYAQGGTRNPFGFDRLAGQPARPEHFSETWSGAAAVWRPLFDEGNNQIPSTGFPVLLIKIDPTLFLRPPEWTKDHFLATEGIVAMWDRCVHFCCPPQWHTAVLPPAYQEYEASRVPRTLSEAGQDPIWCLCHNSQYDPLTFVWDVHPNGTIYVGANMAHGPATRALAAVSIATRGGQIVGTHFTDAALQPPASVVSALHGHPGQIFRDWYFAYCR